MLPYSCKAKIKSLGKIDHIPNLRHQRELVNKNDIVGPRLSETVQGEEDLFIQLSI